MSETFPAAWSRTPDEPKGDSILLRRHRRWPLSAALLLATSFMVRNPVRSDRPRLPSFCSWPRGLAVTGRFLHVENRRISTAAWRWSCWRCVALRGLERSAGHARLRVRPRHRAAPVRVRCWRAGVCVSSLIGIFDRRAARSTKYKVRGVIFIIGAILIFAATIRPLGLVIASLCDDHRSAPRRTRDVRWKRDRDLGGRSHRVLLVPVPLRAQPAVSALAAVLLIGERLPCMNFCQISGFGVSASLVNAAPIIHALSDRRDWSAR